MVYDQAKNIFNYSYRGILSRFDEDEKRFNKIWGAEFLFSINKDVSDKKINEMIDVVMLLW